MGRPKLKEGEHKKGKMLSFDPDVWGHLDKQKNASGYVNTLVRKDMKKMESRMMKSEDFWRGFFEEAEKQGLTPADFEQESWDDAATHEAEDGGGWEEMVLYIQPLTPSTEWATAYRDERQEDWID